VPPSGSESVPVHTKQRVPTLSTHTGYCEYPHWAPRVHYGVPLPCHLLANILNRAGASCSHTPIALIASRLSLRARGAPH
jgi:hypothetical protein